MKTNLQELRAAIIDVVPEIETVTIPCLCKDHGHCPFKDHHSVGRKIGIADVLLALRLNRHEINFDFHIEPQNFAICCDTLPQDERVAFWNLSQDDLALQSEKTKAFLHSILCKK